MTYFRRLILMLQFLTTIPLRVSVKAEREDFGKGLVLAPVVGLVIGALLSAGNYLLGQLFPPIVTAVLTIALYILLTGGLHLDGLGDTADGLLSNRPKERILEIMKDSRVGTNAVLVLIIVLLMNVALLASVPGHTFLILLLMPVAGRVASLVGAGTSRYAGTSNGPGRWCVELCSLKDVISGLIVYCIIFCVAVLLYFSAAAGGPKVAFVFMPALLVPPVSAYLLSKWMGRKLGGVTGDILGAACELNQVIYLVLMYFISKLI